MPKQYSGKEVKSRLTYLGFVEVSQRGSHLKMRAKISGRIRTVIIPMHKQIAHGTLKSILTQAGITKEAFEKSK